MRTTSLSYLSFSFTNSSFLHLSSFPHPLVPSYPRSSGLSSTRPLTTTSLTAGTLLALRSIAKYRLQLQLQSRNLTDIRDSTEGLVRWTSTQVSLGSRPAFRQAIPPHEHLIHTSSPSIITIPQSVLHPAFAAEVSRHRSSSPPIQHTTYPDSLTSRSSPSLHKSHNTSRPVQRPPVPAPAPASFHWKSSVYIDDQFKISNQPRTH